MQSRQFPGLLRQILATGRSIDRRGKHYISVLFTLCSSRTCSSPALLLQLLEAFQQNRLAVCHLLLDALLLVCQAADIATIIIILLVIEKQQNTLHQNTKTTSCAPIPGHGSVDSLLSNVHRLSVSGRDHEARGRGVQLVSSCIPHVPFDPVVPEEGVPLPAQDRTLSTSKSFIGYLPGEGSV